MTDVSGNILHVQGETGKYLRPAPGKPTLNVVDMAHEELQTELRTAIHTAATLGTPTLDREVPDKAGGDFQAMSFSVRPVPQPGFADGLLLLSFQTVARAAPARPAGKRAAGLDDAVRIEALERDLGYARETLRASMEELQSTNEELQSANEELQSANEELETSKEELQSINEELVTVNSELQSKIELLTSLQNDMKNLLDNTNNGVIFLDDDLIVRHYARDASRVFPLIPSDVGRPLADIKSRLVGGDLLPAARTVIETLVPYESELLAAEGVWYLARIQPYRTLDNVINGAVLTFADITENKRVREELQVARDLAEGIVDTVREPLLVLDGALPPAATQNPPPVATPNSST
jgi:two-component system CheB/CheR fusion protein